MFHVPADPCHCQSPGAVIGGRVRVVRKIEALGFPVFASGIQPVDSKGRGPVIDGNVPADCEFC